MRIPFVGFWMEDPGPNLDRILNLESFHDFGIGLFSLLSLRNFCLDEDKMRSPFSSAGTKFGSFQFQQTKSNSESVRFVGHQNQKLDFAEIERISHLVPLKPKGFWIWSRQRSLSIPKGLQICPRIIITSLQQSENPTKKEFLFTSKMFAWSFLHHFFYADTQAITKQKITYNSLTSRADEANVSWSKFSKSAMSLPLIRWPVKIM